MIGPRNRSPDGIVIVAEMLQVSINYARPVLPKSWSLVLPVFCPHFVHREAASAGDRCGCVGVANPINIPDFGTQNLFLRNMSTLSANASCPRSLMMCVSIFHTIDLGEVNTDDEKLYRKFDADSASNTVFYLSLAIHEGLRMIRS